MEQKVYGLKQDVTKAFTSFHENGRIIYRYSCSAGAVYGLGERFCSVNHKGRTLVNRIIDHFTQQEEDTYFPLPFFHTSDGHGVFVHTMCEVIFRFEAEFNEIELADDAEHELHFYYGTPSEIIAAFVRQTGKAVLPPKWSFGVWASANRWSCQKHIEEQLELIRENTYPVSVIVIEAWSDEATFYLWNGAKYELKNGGESFSLEDFTFQEPWPDPMNMIKQIHDQGMKLVLWQCPMIKLLDEGQVCSQHDNDCHYAVQQNLIVKKEDGSPYKILRQWFIGSMVPDFTNPRTIQWWDDKRRYLINEMQVDGFKTDGGEFIHERNAHFYNGRDGHNGSNPYPATYEQVYQSLIDDDRVLFSRAGYIGAQKTPMHWAGDQLSIFSELRAQLNAGLSISLSGIPFWSFDLSGFAGPLPDKELYLRSTAFAAFVPAMQWHSEPVNGQFDQILKGSGGINDRSPWNMAEQLHDTEIMDIALYFANLHMNFLPHFYNEARKAVENDQPLMRHLILDYSHDEQVWKIDDEYMIGDLLIAPVLVKGQQTREIYLPQGLWYDLWTGECIVGGSTIIREVPYQQIPLYLREGGAIALNLTDAHQLGSYVGNRVDCYQELCILYAGEEVEEKEFFTQEEAQSEYRGATYSKLIPGAGVPPCDIRPEGINYMFHDNAGYDIVIKNSEIISKAGEMKLICINRLV